MHWIVPTIAGGALSASMLLIFVSYLNYLVDVYLMYAASAIAANTIIRSAAGAAAPLFTRQMFDALGVGPGGSLIGGVGAVLAVIPFLFYKYGKTIRQKSKFAPTETPQQRQRDEEAFDPTHYESEDPSEHDSSSTVVSADESPAVADVEKTVPGAKKEDTADQEKTEQH